MADSASPRPIWNCILLAGGVAAAGLTASCSSLSCGADHRKLAQLSVGMDYEQVAKIMGCAGRIVSGDNLNTYATIQWDGPDSLLFNRTYVIFLDRKLQRYSTV